MSEMVKSENEYKILEKLKLVSLEDGDLVDLADMQLPVVHKVDPIGYYLKKIDKELELVKERKKDLQTKSLHLKSLQDELKSILIGGLRNHEDNMVRGVETKAWLRTTKKKIPIEENLHDENYLYSIQCNNLNNAQYNMIVNGLKKIGIHIDKTDKKVDISSLSKGQYKDSESTSVSVSNDTGVSNV